MTSLCLSRIADAREVIDPAFLDTPRYRDPVLCARVGRPVLAKIETLNPLRSLGPGRAVPGARPTGGDDGRLRVERRRRPRS